MKFAQICCGGQNFDHEIKSLESIIFDFRSHEQFVSRKSDDEIESI